VVNEAPKLSPSIGRLRVALEHGRRLDAQQLVDRRHDVDGVDVLVAHLAARGDAPRPGHDERVGDAALVAGEALPVRERRVERPRPAGVVVVVRRRAAEVVEPREVLRDVVRDAVEELVLVERAVRAALAAGAVIGDDDDDRVVELLGLLQVVDEPPDLRVGVGHEAGEDLGHAREEPALVGVQ
jgi:hypothetical protein